MFPSQFAKFCFLEESHKMIYTGGYHTFPNIGTLSELAKNYSNKTYILDLISNQVSQKASMSAPRVNHGICRIKDKVFCAGGNSLHVVHKCMEIYDTRNDCWTQGPELNQRKLSLTLVSIEDRYIYSVGQINDTIYLCEDDARFLQIEKLDTQAKGASQKGWELIELKCDLIRAIANISIISLNIK